jgi:sugar lactone lactonase YvrE
MSRPQLMLRTEHYTEGVVVAADGTIFFSMTSQGTIASMHPGSAQSSVWAHVPAANGHAIDEDGSHLVMSSAGSIVRLDESGRAIDIVASKVGALWLTYPNDVTLDPRRGGYYVTDSGYKTMPQTVPPDPQGRVYRVDADKGVRKVAGGIAYANGIALSLDGSRLFVGESLSGRISRPFRRNAENAGCSERSRRLRHGLRRAVVRRTLRRARNSRVRRVRRPRGPASRGKQSDESRGIFTRRKHALRLRRDGR